MEIVDSKSHNRDEALTEETRRLVKRLLGESTGLLKPSWEEDKALSTMKEIVRRLLEKYGHVYDGMMEKLPVDDRGDNAMSTCTVARAVFADGTTNWGRVVSLVAFGVVVCRHLNEKKKKEEEEEEEEGNAFVESVGEQISTYLLTDQKDWLLMNNSWVGFVEFFAEPKHVLKDTFIFFAGFAAIGVPILLNAYKSLFLCE